MTSLTRPQEVNSALMEEKDRVTGISSEERRKEREGKVDIPKSKPALLDAWERGELISFERRVERGQPIDP